MNHKLQMFFCNGNYLFTEDACYNGKHIVSILKENNVASVEITLAKRELRTDYFFCKKLLMVGMKHESCNENTCMHYAPNNGINGRCKHFGYCYEDTGIKYIATIEGKIGIVR